MASLNVQAYSGYRPRHLRNRKRSTKKERADLKKGDRHFDKGRVAKSTRLCKNALQRAIYKKSWGVHHTLYPSLIARANGLNNYNPRKEMKNDGDTITTPD